MRKQLVRSPLEMVVQDKRLTAILEAMRDAIKCAGEFRIPVEDVCRVREVIQAAMEEGEKGLYRFAQDLVDRMVGSRKKQNGFEAYKIVIHRNQQVVEVQLQTRAILERETTGFRANHHTYKEKQMRLRAKLGEQCDKFLRGLETLLCIRKTDFTEAPFGNTECQTSIKLGYSHGREGFTRKEIFYARL